MPAPHPVIEFLSGNLENIVVGIAGLVFSVALAAVLALVRGLTC